MEKVLNRLFDFQKFEQNKALSEVIDSVTERYQKKPRSAKIIPLSDELLNLAVAGTGMQPICGLEDFSPDEKEN
ncbi:MAG: hypothetical protein K6G83_11320 [Lachnospiraceae bacterium]|nr:hypothetical protein [Lachnospiraceae bacterium]